MRIISDKNKDKIVKRARKYIDKLWDYKMTQVEKDFLAELISMNDDDAICALEAKALAKPYWDIQDKEGYGYDFDKEARELLGYEKDDDGYYGDPLSITTYFEACNGTIEYAGVKILLSWGGPSSWIDTKDSCYHFSNWFCHGKWRLPEDFISALDRYCYSEADYYRPEEVIV